MKEELEKLGLTENETTVYIALLTLGGTSAGNIIKKTKLHRNIVYDNLDRLIEKGLVSYVIVHNIKRFESTTATELKEYVKKQKEEMLNKEKIVNNLLPKLNAMRTTTQTVQEATIFKGKRGLKTVLDEMAGTAGELLVFGTGWGMRETMDGYYDQWHLKLRQNKVKGRILLPENKRGSLQKPFIPKYLPEKNIIPSTIAVYEDKLLNVIWGEEPIAVLIISDKTAESYKRYFAMLWNMAKP